MEYSNADFLRSRWPGRQAAIGLLYRAGYVLALPELRWLQPDRPMQSWECEAICYLIEEHGFGGIKAALGACAPSAHI